MTDWDKRFLDLAQYIAGWSKDRSTKVGCVIAGDDHTILSIGYNGFPRGVNDDIESRHERPEKYKWVEHAERNAIANAARVGISLINSTAYIPFLPCAECARQLIQAGIKRIVCNKPDFDDPRWDRPTFTPAADFMIVSEMLSECGISIDTI